MAAGRSSRRFESPRPLAIVHSTQNPSCWSPARKLTNVLWTTFNFTWIAANTTCIGVIADAAQDTYHVDKDAILALSSVIVILMAIGSLAVAPLGERASCLIQTSLTLMEQ